MQNVLKSEVIPLLVQSESLKSITSALYGEFGHEPEDEVSLTVGAANAGTAAIAKTVKISVNFVFIVFSPKILVFNFFRKFMPAQRLHLITYYTDFTDIWQRPKPSYPSTMPFFTAGYNDYND